MVMRVVVSHTRDDALETSAEVPRVEPVVEVAPVKRGTGPQDVLDVGVVLRSVGDELVDYHVFDGQHAR